MCVYSQGWVCADAAPVETVEPGQQGGRRTTSAAGSQWPAWSSAGPATQTFISADISTTDDVDPQYQPSVIHTKTQ